MAGECTTRPAAGTRGNETALVLLSPAGLEVLTICS
jgi:hypothetical protein